MKVVETSTSIRQTESFDLLCVKIGSRVWAVHMAKNFKIKKSPDVYMSPPCGVATATPIQTKFGEVGVPCNVIIINVKNKCLPHKL